MDLSVNFILLLFCSFVAHLYILYRIDFIQYLADEQVGDLVVVQHRLVATVGHKLPPTAKPNVGLMEAQGGREALLARVAGVRDRIFSLLMPEDVTERQWRYAGTEPVELGGNPLAAYRISFELNAAITCDAAREAVWEEPEDQEPTPADEQEG